MFTVVFILALLALIFCVLAINGRTPLWISVLLLTLALLLQSIPVGHLR